MFEFEAKRWTCSVSVWCSNNVFELATLFSAAIFALLLSTWRIYVQYVPANSSTFKMRSKVEEMLMFKKFSKWQNKPITRVLLQMFWILWQQFITLLIPWKFIFGQNHGLTLEWSHFFQIFTPLNCLKLELTWQQYQEKKYFIFAREKIPLSRPFCNWSTLQCVAPHPSKQRCNKGACICQQEFWHFVKLERPNSYGNWLNIKA